jgi:hypothetical protein
VYPNKTVLMLQNPNSMIQPRPTHGLLMPSPIANLQPQQPFTYNSGFQFQQPPQQEPHTFNTGIRRDDRREEKTPPKNQNQSLGSAFMPFNNNNNNNNDVNMSQRQHPHQSQPTAQTELVVQPREQRNQLVFQCKGCREVVGDSNSFVIANRELDYIVLQAVTDSVKINPDMGISDPNDLDRGSIFLKLLCSRCSSYIGKRYQSTTGVPAEYKDRYCLFRAMLQSYELGNVQTNNTEVLDSLPTCHSLQQENIMVQRILLVHKESFAAQAERIKQLEQQMAELHQLFNETKKEQHEQKEQIKKVTKLTHRLEINQRVIKAEEVETTESRRHSHSQNKRKRPM